MEIVVVNRDIRVGKIETVRKIYEITEQLGIEHFYFEPIDNDPSIRLISYEITFDSDEEAMAFKLVWI